ncbi:MAG TPA: hypothetical protein VKU01_10220, partial [Bryobacteraceae bacterium]|nr:hypothetical protein [Bryobacteraceae bacterium]
ETVIYAESEPDAAAGTRDLNPGKAAAPPTKAAPQLRIEVVGPKSMGAGQSYNVEIRVTNLGRAPAQKLALEVGLPDGLEHEVARNLAQKVGDLPPGGMHRALLRLKAQKTGKAIVRIDLERDAEVVATSSATIDIAEKAVASERILLLDCCCPPPPCCGY